MNNGVVAEGRAERKGSTTSSRRGYYRYERKYKKEEQEQSEREGEREGRSKRKKGRGELGRKSGGRLNM